MLRNCERDLFLRLRDGELSLSQVVSRIEGRIGEYFDDMKNDIHPTLLMKPTKFAYAAYQDELQEK